MHSVLVLVLVGVQHAFFALAMPDDRGTYVLLMYGDLCLQSDKEWKLPGGKDMVVNRRTLAQQVTSWLRSTLKVDGV